MDNVFTRGYEGGDIPIPERTGGAALRADQFTAPYNAVERPVAGRFITTVDKGGPVKYHIFLLHGGGYVMDAMKEHTDKVKALADLGIRVTAFAYPLAPETPLPMIHAAVEEAYNMARELYPEDKFALYGDSAGGGLALYLLMKLRDKNDPNRPVKTILVSPALDMCFTNPEIPKYAEVDTSLNLELLLTLNDVLAAGADRSEPQYSPIRGNHDDLGEILMFCGEKEILRADCEVFAAETPKGTDIKFYVAPDHFHDYLLFVAYGDEEAAKAFKMIDEFLS